MADEENATEAEAEVPKPRSKLKTIIIGVVALAAFVGGGLAFPKIMVMINGEPPAEVGADGTEVSPEPVADTGPALYYPILPPLTSNFPDDLGRRRFIQISLEVMAREQSVIDEVKDHGAVIRNALLMALSDVNYETVVTRAGKEQLRQTALKEIQAVLTERTGEPGVEDVYLTSFVVQ